MRTSWHAAHMAKDLQGQRSHTRPARAHAARREPGQGAKRGSPGRPRPHEDGRAPSPCCGQGRQLTHPALGPAPWRRLRLRRPPPSTRSRGSEDSVQAPGGPDSSGRPLAPTSPSFLEMLTGSARTQERPPGPGPPATPHSPDGLDDFMSSIVVFVLKNRGTGFRADRAVQGGHRRAGTWGRRHCGAGPLVSAPPGPRSSRALLWHWGAIPGPLPTRRADLGQGPRPRHSPCSRRGTGPVGVCPHTSPPPHRACWHPAARMPQPGPLFPRL